MGVAVKRIRRFAVGDILSVCVDLSGYTTCSQLVATGVQQDDHCRDKIFLGVCFARASQQHVRAHIPS